MGTDTIAFNVDRANERRVRARDKDDEKAKAKDFLGQKIAA